MKALVVPSLLLCVLSFIPAKNKPPGTSIVIDDPLLVKGLVVEDFDHHRCIQLQDGSRQGLAEVYFFDESAKYDITIAYLDEPNGKSTLAIRIDDRPAGTILFDGEDQNSKPYVAKKKILPGIDIQQWSKITLQFTGDGMEKCRIEKITLTPVGAFGAKKAQLAKPVTLDVWETSAEWAAARQMLPAYVNGRIDSLMAIRKARLESLKTPAEWMAVQQKTRMCLDSFFGKFPAKTPLNPTITGKIEREKYTIEKLYFESRPHYYVTANLYIPKNRRLPAPGVLFTCGHSDNGKASLLYHSACLGLVLKGYVVLAIDPTGQGERIEYFDPRSNKQNVAGAVSQHYYLGRPSFLVNRTLSGLRTWDAIRAVDYLVSRPEVDSSKLAAVGNSGGGQMALLITAVDNRIKVCAAGHPGGQMEKNYLPGQNLIDRQIFGLIAPRPVRIIVGDRSGEEAPHRKKIEDIQLYMQGLGYEKNRADIVIVDGIHDLRLPKREAVYEWLNRWMDKEEEGKTEPVITPENEKDLTVTKTGLTLVSLGGETGQSFNTQHLRTIYKSDKDTSRLKKRIAARIGLTVSAGPVDVKIQTTGTIDHEGYTVEKLSYQSEEGIHIPALLIKPHKVQSQSPVYIYAGERGKPRLFGDTLTPFVLAKKGYIVLAIDVRGTGETNPTGTLPAPVKYATCTPVQWIHDCLAIQSPGFGQTMLAMRTHDVMRAVDCIASRQDLQQRKIIVYGEGTGGLWALLAAVYDNRIDEVVTAGTLASYKLAVTHKYYALSSDYFWVPGALCDFDIPDLARLVAPKKQVWIDPVNELGEPLTKAAAAIIGSHKNLHITAAKHD